MADQVIAPYEENRLNAAIGHGTIYTVLGVIVSVGLLVAVIAGLTSDATFGLLTSEQAFMMGGLALVVICAATLVLMFSLTGTIRYINREMEDLTRLREAITTSYNRLASSTENLGDQISELRQTLPAIRKLAQESTKRARRKA